MARPTYEIEPPYGVISDALKEGQVIPFLGAGVNFNRPKDAKYGKDSAFLPSGAELSEILADHCSFPSNDGGERADLAKVSSYHVEASGRKRDSLRKQLHKIFDRDYEPCPIHNYLAKINKPLLIVTTNYDVLMEHALKDAGRPFHLVVHPTDRKDVEGSVLWWRPGADKAEAVPPNILDIKLDETTVVYKMHGTVDRLQVEGDSYVITEDDYVDFLAGMTRQGVVPAIFLEHFRTRQFLFMGYGLRDWNLRVVLKNLKRPNDDSSNDNPLSSWAIQYLPSAPERELWQSRNVKIFNIKINDFVKRLQEIEG